MRVDLLGYLLGALDATEQYQVETELKRNPALRIELHRLQQELAPLDVLQETFEPPPGLAARTCQFVDRAVPDRASESTARRREAAGGASSRWSLRDLVGAGVTSLCLALVFLPALHNGRVQARIVQCQHNLQFLGNRLAQFSDVAPDRCFPGVPESGKRAFAGIWGPLLAHAGQLTSSNRENICPGSPLADCLTARPLARLDEIDRATGESLLEIQRVAGGSYAYPLGFVVNGLHCAIRNQGRPYFPILADEPSLHRPGLQSVNHGGLGENYLFEDGHVQFVTGNKLSTGGDDPLRNREGFVESGRDSDDAVLASSTMRPFPDRPPILGD